MNPETTLTYTNNLTGSANLRRCRVCPAARAIRYIDVIEQ